MLIGLMQGIGIFYYWTWFLWPFVFVFSLALGLTEVIKDKEAPGKHLYFAAISLLIILAGVTAPAFS